MLDGQRAAGQRRHARRGRGVVGKVDRRHVRLEQIDIAAQFVGRDGLRRLDLSRDHKLPVFEAAFQVGDRLAILRGVVFGIALPPLRLAHRSENAVPGAGHFLLVQREKTAHHLAQPIFPGLLEQTGHLFTAHHFPIQGGQHFQQQLLAAHLEGPLVDLVPDAGTGFVDVAAFGGGSPAGSVAQALGAVHRADEGGLLQEAVTALPAAPDGAFDQQLCLFQHPVDKGFVSEGIVGWLPAAAGG